MKTGFKRCLCIIIVAALLAGGLPEAVLAEEDGINVCTREEFMSALQQKKSPIIVSNLITIGEEADVDNRMLPVKIPAGTVIRGDGNGNGNLNCRCPIQLEGDACFQDIRLTFESTNALGSVPHREIFLAGHSLTFDNVNTWLQGGGNDLGPLGGDEEELLPTVYAGGYTNTAVGENASLTVRNSNDKTMFQAIYMGHGTGIDNKVPYQGTAVMDLDTKFIVREGVDVSQNSQAQITIAGNTNDYARTNEFFGNEKTTLVVRNCSISEAVVENIGNIILTDRACLYAKTSTLGNITLQQGSCLDLTKTEAADVLISGNFSGVEDPAEERGNLVVNPKYSLLIEGTVAGTTWFKTISRFYPGYFMANRPYISVNKENASAGNFVLSEESIESGYQLNYDAGVWSVVWENQGETKMVGGIEIVSAPSQVVLGRIESSNDGTVPDENVYFEIIWRDMEGNEFSAEEAQELGLYEVDYVFRVKAEYWDSDDPDILASKDWGNTIWLMASEEHPGKYFLEATEGAKTGEYIFLFCSDYCADTLETVQDVKNLGNQIKAECRVTFLDKEPEPTPTPTAAPTVKPTQEPVVTPGPEVTPTAMPTVKPTQEPAVTPGSGVTPTAVPTQTPGQEVTPTVTPTSEPTSTPVIEPTVKPTPEPESTLEPEVTPTATPTTEPMSTPVMEPTVKPTMEPVPTLYPDVTPSAETDKTPVTVVNPPGKMILSAESFVYTGKALKPKVTVTDTKGNVISSENYQLSYQNNVKVGIASVIVRFNGAYSGSLSKTFEILPKGTKISRLTAKSKGFLVKWKKQRVQTTGYEIQYSTSRKFLKKTRMKETVKGTKKVTRKITGKQPGKRYYVRVRTYKSVQINGRTKKIYSGWSGIKSIKI